MQERLIFLISPVARVTPEENARIGAYVEGLEASGCRVHWPIRDTVQEDPSGGYVICQANFRAIMAADEIHIWYNETSGGSKFDMGGVFMLVAMMNWTKRIVIANEAELPKVEGKNLAKVMRGLIDDRGLA